jgi:hypothetical protein
MMKVKQAVIECMHCNKPFACQIYTETDERGWTLFSDGYLYHPFSQPPWHRVKICPHCDQGAQIKEDSFGDVEADLEMSSGDVYAPRNRVRRLLTQVPEKQRAVRRDLMIMDMWISNHICGDGCDDYTTNRMKELLDVENDLDLVIRADIQRQLGRFEAAREGLLTVQRASKNADRRRRLHIKAILAFVSRGVTEAMPVLSEGDFVPPTGRLAIHKRVVYKGFDKN